jgi:hypothetical protein
MFAFVGAIICLVCLRLTLYVYFPTSLVSVLFDALHLCTVILGLAGFRVRVGDRVWVEFRIRIMVGVRAVCIGLESTGFFTYHISLFLRR